MSEDLQAGPGYDTGAVPKIAPDAEPAIVCDDVSKRFRLFTDKPTSLKEAVTRRRSRYHDFWAVRDVSLRVPRGSFYGLIGHNGSGKSTLLRVIAGIHRPTTGRVWREGRVSALLELGAGFHQELTGRENVYLNGSILGLSRRQIDERFDEIVDFAGIGDFIDSPVKVYSSGMYVRLGFAVAVHVDPEILIIDEVIAVGDEDFQRRCFDHLFALRRRGVTIVLVSHAADLVQRMCDRVAWLDHGRLMADGPAADTVRAYLDSVNRDENERLGRSGEHPVVSDEPAEDRAARRGSGDIRVVDVTFQRPDGRPLATASSGDALVVRLHYRAVTAVDEPVFGVAFDHESGTNLAGPNTQLGGVDTGTVGPGRGHVDFAVDHLALLPGTYSLSTVCGDQTGLHIYDQVPEQVLLRVQQGSSPERFGLVDLQGRWSSPIPDD